MKKLLFALLLNMCLCGCSKQIYYGTHSSLIPEKIIAIDLEEDGYLLSSGQDEVHIRYMMAAIDSKNRLVDRVFQSYGPVTFSRRGQELGGFKNLSVTVPASGKLYIEFQLVEDDDYSSVSQTLDDAGHVVDVVKHIESKRKNPNIRFLKGLRTVSRGISWLGIAVTVIDFFDTDDVLLSQGILLDEHDLQQLQKQYQTQHVLSQSGRNYGDYFHYRVVLSLEGHKNRYDSFKIREKDNPYSKKRTNKYSKTHRERSTPRLAIDVSPISTAQNQKKLYWTALNDKLGGYTNTENPSVVDLFTNHAYALSLQIPISKELNGEKFNSRFYLQPEFQKLSLISKSFQGTKLGSIYGFSSAEKSSIVSSTVNFQHKAAFLKWTLLSKGVFLDIGAGVSSPESEMTFNFNNKKFDKTYLITDTQLQGAMIFGFGLGHYGDSFGVKVHASMRSYLTNLKTNDQFEIYDSSGKIVSFISTDNHNALNNYTLGLTLMF